MATKTIKKKAARRPANKARGADTTIVDPTTDQALRALDSKMATPPDLPVAVAVQEMASLARLARARVATLAKIGVSLEMIDTLGRFAKRLAALEKAWQRAREERGISRAERKLLAEAEALDSKLLAGGRWACRDDEQAQAELSRIAEGSGLADTIQDLRDEVEFWKLHAGELQFTDITSRDLARAVELADALDAAAAREAEDLASADALSLRNRCFWAGDALARTIREGGRYAFRSEPKVASKFISRYRAAIQKRSRRAARTRAQDAQSRATAAAPANGA